MDDESKIEEMNEKVAILRKELAMLRKELGEWEGMVVKKPLRIKEGAAVLVPLIAILYMGYRLLLLILS